MRPSASAAKNRARAARRPRAAGAARRRPCVADVADHLRGLRADLRIAVREKLRQLRGVLGGFRPRQLRDAPDPVDAAEAVDRVARCGEERLQLVPAHQLELRLLPDAHVGVAQQRRRFATLRALKFSDEQRLHFFPHRAARGLRGVELPEPARCSSSSSR